ncbi:hypothetical protein HDU86_002583 [Geranomyces michiganensis]|nr:hypothetical protein HDU86_002583 [Geranomyces michiganensis]
MVNHRVVRDAGGEVTKIDEQEDAETAPSAAIAQPKCDTIGLPSDLLNNNILMTSHRSPSVISGIGLSFLLSPEFPKETYEKSVLPELARIDKLLPASAAAVIDRFFAQEFTFEGWRAARNALMKDLAANEDFENKIRWILYQNMGAYFRAIFSEDNPLLGWWR